MSDESGAHIWMMAMVEDLSKDGQLIPNLIGRDYSH